MNILIILTFAPMQSRHHALDYLRGLAALSIMIYHYAGFVYGHFDASTFIQRVGVYGVSIFYILSGLTLYLVYNKRWDNSLSTLKDFTLKRLFRIFPLLWLVMAGTILFKGIPDVSKVILNATGLFGFISPISYIGISMWSIGNELVFYAFFPFLMLLVKRSVALFFTGVTLLGLLYTWFAFAGLSPAETMAEQWETYINPLNQVFLFATGIALAYWFKQSTFNKVSILSVLLLSIAAFALVPTEGDAIHLVTGINRLLFTVFVATVCFCFYKLPFSLPAWLHNPLSFLGEVSYGMYLLHPVVYLAINKALGLAGVSVTELTKVVAAIPLTLLSSYIVYTYFEKYFIQLGKRYSQQQPIPYVKAPEKQEQPAQVEA